MDACEEPASGLCEDAAVDMVCAEVDAVAWVVVESVEWLGGTAATDITKVRGSSHAMCCAGMCVVYGSIDAIICAIHHPSPDPRLVPLEDASPARTPSK